MSQGGLVLERHNDDAKEWGTLSDRALNSSLISYKPKINSRTVYGEMNGAVAWVATVGQDGGGTQDGEGTTGQATVPDESRADLSVYFLWKGGASALFYMQIVNLDAVSYLLQTSSKALEMVEKEKK